MAGSVRRCTLARQVEVASEPSRDQVLELGTQTRQRRHPSAAGLPEHFVEPPTREHRLARAEHTRAVDPEQVVRVEEDYPRSWSSQPWSSRASAALLS